MVHSTCKEHYVYFIFNNTGYIFVYMESILVRKKVKCVCIKMSLRIYTKMLTTFSSEEFSSSVIAQISRDQESYSILI